MLVHVLQYPRRLDLRLIDGPLDRLTDSRADAREYAAAIARSFQPRRLVGGAE